MPEFSGQATIAAAQAMETLGANLRPLLEWPRCICFLNGPLGAGKTTLVRGFLRALGHVGPVKSPTYTLVEPYPLVRQVYHFDLYRLNSADDLETLGFRDYLDGPGLCFIEWPERAQLPTRLADLLITIDYAAPGRVVRFESDNPLAAGIMPALLSIAGGCE